MPQTFTGQGDTNVVLQSSHLLEKSEENEASRAEQTKQNVKLALKVVSVFLVGNPQIFKVCDPFELF